MSVQKDDNAQSATTGTSVAESDAASEDESQPADEEPAEELSLDVTFEVLKNERRRYVLKYLKEHDDQVSLGELAEYIAALENDTTIDALTAQQRKRVYVGLYQCHLPKMDDAGIVEFDRNRGFVEASGNVDHLEKYLDVEATPETDWPAYYFSIAVGGGALLAAGQLGLYPFAWLESVVVLAVLAAVAACAAVQHRREQAS